MAGAVCVGLGGVGSLKKVVVSFEASKPCNIPCWLLYFLLVVQATSPQLLQPPLLLPVGMLPLGTDSNPQGL